MVQTGAAKEEAGRHPVVVLPEILETEIMVVA